MANDPGTKRILIVDDDEFLRDGIKAALKNEKFEMTFAENGNEARMLLEQTKYDLIISDVQMPVMDGLQLLAWVRKHIQSRFLLMTEPSAALQTRHAYMLGADEFLNKPFSKVDFLKAVHAAIGSLETPSELEEDYIAVPMDEFITGSTLRVDLFVRLPTERFVKVANKGGKLTQDRIDAYMAKGLTSLFMRKKDYAAYVSFNINIAQMAHGEDRLECTRKIRLTKYVTETVITQLCEAGLKKEQLESASSVVMNAVDLVSHNPVTLRFLDCNDVMGSLPSHSIAASVWACLIAKRVGWKGQSTFFKVALCSLFHDVGEKELDPNLLAKPRFERTQGDMKTIQSHTFRGRDILQSVPFMPEDVAIVAFQHHELMNGGGYPHGIKHDQIHPIARLISVANAFCELLSEMPADTEDRLSKCYEALSRNKRDYDQQFFSRLGDIVNEAVANKSAA